MSQFTGRASVDRLSYWTGLWKQKTSCVLLHVSLLCSSEEESASEILDRKLFIMYVYVTCLLHMDCGYLYELFVYILLFSILLPLDLRNILGYYS